MSYRILSLDGGGMRGIITARILKEVENRLGKPLNQHFDLIAGTSTGSLLAAGIALGKDIDTLINIYKEDGLSIFPYQSLVSPRRLPLVFQYGLSAPKYSNHGLIQTVKKRIGEKYTLSSIVKPRLLITSYDTTSRSAIIFKSWRMEKWYNQPTVKHPDSAETCPLPLWMACVSSASAPTFFPAFRVEATLDNSDSHASKPHEYSLIDGGVCANNPAACAVAEAIRILLDEQRQHGGTVQDALNVISKIQVLSIGTGDLTRELPWRKVRQWGLLQWGLRIADVLMDAPSDIHDYVARQIITEVLAQDHASDRLDSSTSSSPNTLVKQRYLRLQLNRQTLELLNPDTLKISMDDARLSSLDQLEQVAQRYITEPIKVDGKDITVKKQFDDFIENLAQSRDS